MALEMNGLSQNKIQASLSPGMVGTEESLKQMLIEMGPSPTPGDLLKVQAKLSQFSLQAQIQSSVLKELSEMLKGIIQKAA